MFDYDLPEKCNDPEIVQLKNMTQRKLMIWAAAQKKRENKQTIGWCVEKTQKALVLHLFFCVRKVDCITTSFKSTKHGTSHCELIWTVSLFFESSPNPWWVHTSWISTVLATKKILGGEVTQSIVGSNSDPYLPDANITQLLGIEEQLPTAVFSFIFGPFGRFRFLFFWGKWSTRKFSWKAPKKVSGFVKLRFLGRVFAYHLRSYPILAANKPENMRLDGSGQHLGGKTDGFLRHQGQQGAVGFRKMWGVDGFTRCEGYKMLGKSWWCFSNHFFLDGEKLVLNFKLTPCFLLTTGVKTL